MCVIGTTTNIINDTNNNDNNNNRKELTGQKQQLSRLSLIDGMERDEYYHTLYLIYSLSFGRPRSRQRSLHW